MHKLTPSRIRKIRKTLGMSQREFGHILWAALTTVAQWESGKSVPVALHRRLLMLLDQALANPAFEPIVGDPRANDPLFVLYRILEPLYAGRAANARGQNAPQH